MTRLALAVLKRLAVAASVRIWPDLDWRKWRYLGSGPGEPIGRRRRLAWALYHWGIS